MFFNENGILDIDEMVVNNESFKVIMEDQMVSEDEIKSQSDKVLAMLRKIEENFTLEQQEVVKALLSEASVLYAIYNIYSIQNINQ